MSRWHKVEAPNYSKIQKKLDTFVEKMKLLQEQIEIEAKRLADLTEQKKGAE